MLMHRANWSIGLALALLWGVGIARGQQAEIIDKCTKLAEALKSKDRSFSTESFMGFLDEASSLSWERLNEYHKNSLKKPMVDTGGGYGAYYGFLKLGGGQDSINEKDWAKEDTANRKKLLLKQFSFNQKDLEWLPSEGMAVVSKCLDSKETGLTVTLNDNEDTGKGFAIIGYRPFGPMPLSVRVTDVQWTGQRSAETKQLPKDGVELGMKEGLQSFMVLPYTRDRCRLAGYPKLAVTVVATGGVEPKSATQNATPDLCAAYRAEVEKYKHDLAGWYARREAAKTAQRQYQSEITQWSNRDIWHRPRVEVARNSENHPEVTDLEAPDETWVCTGAGASINNDNNFRYFSVRFTQIKDGKWGESKWVQKPGKDAKPADKDVRPDTKVELPEGWVVTGLGLREEKGDLKTIVIRKRKFDPMKLVFVGAPENTTTGEKAPPERSVFTDDELIVGVEAVGTGKGNVHTLEVLLAKPEPRGEAPAVPPPFKEAKPRRPGPPPAGCDKSDPCR